MGMCMWDGTKQRKEGNGIYGIFMPPCPAIERSQREGRKHERADMTKELEEALAMAKTCIGLKHFFPKGNQT